MTARFLIVFLSLLLAARAAPMAFGEAPELIVHHGVIVTVDKDFSIQQAMACANGRVVRLGTNEAILALAGPTTTTLDLHGAMVLPGLIDSHVHAANACMTEFDHPLPDFQTIADVLDYVRARTKVVEKGAWISLSQVFITRLKEQRYPTRAELDEAAPNNPVVFATGPDASVNSLALRVSGIDKDFSLPPDRNGRIERDPATGEPTGILRACGDLIKARSTARSPTPADRFERLRLLFADYNAHGITGVIDRNMGADALKLYQQLHESGKLTLRVAGSRGIGNAGPIRLIEERIAAIGKEPEVRRGAMVRTVGVKTFLDGGMLTGSAYMRQPWGRSTIYAIDDPEYRGMLYITHDRLVAMARAAVKANLQFTAHAVGDGAVHALLDAYEEVNKDLPVAPTRPCLTHSNFMSKEAVEQAARLGVCVDIQPAWLWLDAHTLVKQFGYDRLRFFQPLKSLFDAGVVVGGGSDHMQRIDSLRGVNPYHPFLAMWVAITRRSRQFERPLHPEEALDRRQAIRFYTINNARLMFLEDEIGSLEPGKYADFIVLDRDILQCPVDAIRETRVTRTYLAGKPVHAAPDAPAATP